MYDLMDSNPEITSLPLVVGRGDEFASMSREELIDSIIFLRNENNKLTQIIKENSTINKAVSLIDIRIDMVIENPINHSFVTDDGTKDDSRLIGFGINATDIRSDSVFYLSLIVYIT